MDELSPLPTEHLQKPSSRLRTVSLGVKYHKSASPSSSSTTTARPESTLRHRVLSTTLPSTPREIIAPKPQRHLLDSSTSPLWLRTPPPPSPTSSRATSPLSYPASPRTHTHSFHHYNNASGTTSFSALFHRQDSPSSPAIVYRPPGSSTRSSRHAQPDTFDAGAGKAWINWMHGRGLKPLVVPAAILASLFVKVCLGIGSYSGRGTPPMYGDYEAQRHWMELTVHLPFRQWYTYDLHYWGLDYPPLTAYVSWLFGTIGSWIEPSWFALDESRGIETEGSKLFMRSTVIIADILVYIPALWMFIRSFHGTRSRRAQGIALLTLLFQPALLLIDNGHFQYNSVMLGLTLFALNFFSIGHDLWGAVCFTLSLGFKQMSLYYAPAIGTYLLAKCIYLGRTHGAALFLRLATVTTLTLLLLFLPFLPPFTPLTTILEPIKRIFPFARGLFEDKVANFWCASNVVIKWKNWGQPRTLIKFSAGLTTLGFLPSVINLIRAGLKFQVEARANGDASKQSLSQTKRAVAPAPFLALLPYALLTSSMSFFLFSFQVHEKTILLPLLPLTLLLSGAPTESSVFAWGVLVNNTAVFSMWPLLKRDGLGLQYIAMVVLWNRLIGYNPFSLPFKQAAFSIAAYAAFFVVHVAELLLKPPARYPDLFAVLNVLLCTPVFGLAWLWSIKSGIEVGWALGGLGAGTWKSSEALKERQRRQSVSSESIATEGESFRERR